MTRALSTIALSLSLFMVGCRTFLITPSYLPSEELAARTPSAATVRLEVSTSRSDDRLLGKTADVYGLPIESDRPVSEILTDAFREALPSAGYAVSDDARTLYRVEVRDFSVTWSQGFGADATANVSVLASVRRDDRTLASRQFRGSRTKDIPWTHADGSRMAREALSAAMSHAVDQAVLDDNLRDAIEGPTSAKPEARRTAMARSSAPTSGSAPLRTTAAPTGGTISSWTTYRDTHGRYECRYPPGSSVRHDDAGRYWRTLFQAPGGDLFAVKVRKEALPAAGPRHLSEESKALERDILTKPLVTIRTRGMIDRVHYDRQTTLFGRPARRYAVSGPHQGARRYQVYLQLICDGRPFTINLVSEDSGKPDELEAKDALFSSFLGGLSLLSCRSNQPQDSLVGSLASGPYVDPRGHFRIEPPAGWRLETFPNDARGRARWHAPDSDATLSVLVKPSEVEVHGVDDLIDTLRRNDQRLGIRAEMERVSYPGGDAIRRSFRVERIDSLVVSFFVDGGMAHDVIVMGSSEDLESHRDQLEKSIRSYQPLVRVTPDEELLRQRITSRLRRAETSLEQGKRDAARYEIEKGLELAPDDEGLLALDRRLRTTTRQAPPSPALSGTVSVEIQMHGAGSIVVGVSELDAKVKKDRVSLAFRSIPVGTPIPTEYTMHHDIERIEIGDGWLYFHGQWPPNVQQVAPNADVRKMPFLSLRIDEVKAVTEDLTWRQMAMLLGQGDASVIIGTHIGPMAFIKIHPPRPVKVSVKPRDERQMSRPATAASPSPLFPRGFKPDPATAPDAPGYSYVAVFSIEPSGAAGTATWIVLANDSGASVFRGEKRRSVLRFSLGSMGRGMRYDYLSTTRDADIWFAREDGGEVERLSRTSTAREFEQILLEALDAAGIEAPRIRVESAASGRISSKSWIHHLVDVGRLTRR